MVHLLRIPASRGCPLCGSPRAGTEALVHCSHEGCALNRVDIPAPQWEERAFEEDLICEVDRLRDALARANAGLVDVSSKLRLMKDAEAARLMAWRAERGLPSHRIGKASQHRIV